MTPFSTIIPVSKYMSMEFTPKSGNTIYNLDRGQYSIYCVITSHDVKTNDWFGRVRGKIEKVNIKDKHIEIRVVPFEQHMALLRRGGSR